MVAQGADYLKIDSCGGSQDHAVAFSDYAKFRDAMNATGETIWLSLCGWREWYSPPDPALNYSGGSSLGNSWRIAGDGNNWEALTNCMNTQASAAPYAGIGGWPDPDLLIGPEVYVGEQTDAQARAQFSMWSLFPTNLLISQNMLRWSAYALETYSNVEAIAINQDPMGSPAQRIVGGDLSFPCRGGVKGALAAVTAVVACDATDPYQLWDFDSSTGTISPRAFANANGVLSIGGKRNGTPVYVVLPVAGDDAQVWQWTDGVNITITNKKTGLCLDVYNWEGPVDAFTCNGGSNQKFVLGASGLLRDDGSGHGATKCFKAAPYIPGDCTNVWGRKLSGGDFAIGMVNNGADVQKINCDAACFASMGVTTGSYAVRDVWAHKVVATVSPPYHFAASVNVSGSAALFRLTPEPILPPAR